MAALAASLSMPIAAHAQSAPAAQRKEAELPGVNVTVDREVPYKADTSSSPKMTQPLLDTPKTVQVIKKEMIQEQGASTLMEALRNTPGITMQLGENGNTSAGDAFQLRGFSTANSTFLDGIRDLGPVTRDVFNLDSVEVVKGPSGSDIGRGASSGYINLISKLPFAASMSEASLTLGTADRKRFTADFNRQFGESGAFRLNVMGQDSGVDGRDFVKNKGFGIAPGVAFGLGTRTRVYLYSQHLRQDNVPDGGIPTIGMDGFFNANAALNGGAKVRRENFYGSRNDYEKVTADMATLRIEHDWAPGTTLRSITRYGRTSMDRVLTGINTLAFVTANPASWTVSRSRQRVDQTNEILANQTSVNTSFLTAGLKNDLSVGVELMYERQLTLGTGTAAQLIRGVNYPATASPAANLYTPNPDDNLGTPYLTGVDTEGKTLTAAVYAFDTLTLSEAWKLNGGLRLERYNTTTSSGTIVTAANLATFPGYAVGGVAPANLSDSRNLVSWNLGVVYKPAPNASIYAAVANSLTPPGSANFTLSATAGNQANAALDPQETRHYELGTKWDLLNKRLNLTAAVFRTINDKQTTQDPVTATVVQSGKTRVQGIELAAVGQLTNFWQVAAGISKLNTKQIDQQAVAAGVVTVTDAVRWTPDLTASLWTSYTWGAFTLGGGARYVSEQLRVINGANPATQVMPKIPAYAVADLMLAYQVSKSVKLRLNVYNLFDKEYINTLNNGGGRVTMGAPRSVALTGSVLF